MSRGLKGSSDQNYGRAKGLVAMHGATLHTHSGVDDGNNRASTSFLITLEQQGCKLVQANKLQHTHSISSITIFE